MKLEAKRKKPGRAILLRLAPTSPLPSTARKRQKRSQFSLWTRVARMDAPPAWWERVYKNQRSVVSVRYSVRGGQQAGLVPESLHDGGKVDADPVEAADGEQDQD